MITGFVIFMSLCVTTMFFVVSGSLEDDWRDKHNLQEATKKSVNDAKKIATVENVLTAISIAFMFVSTAVLIFKHDNLFYHTFPEQRGVLVCICAVMFFCIYLFVYFQCVFAYRFNKDIKQMKKVLAFREEHKDYFYGIAVTADIGNGLAVKTLIPSDVLAFKSKEDAKKMSENLFLRISKDKIDVRTYQDSYFHFDTKSKQIKEVFTDSKSIGIADAAVTILEQGMDSNDEGDYFNVSSNRPEHPVIGDGVEHDAKLLNQEELNQFVGDKEIDCPLSTIQLGLRKR